jgi:membrane-associated phospholipid phosphatase
MRWWPDHVGYGVRVRARTSWLMSWLFLVAAVQIVAFEVVRQVFVKTVRGQQVDTIALAGSAIGESHVSGLVSTVLNTVSVLSVLVATVAIGFIALIRGRVLLAAVATLTILGANLTTQLVKAFTTRPDLGIDVERVTAGNSLPSGHTTVTASVAVALVLVAPAAVRGVAALAGTGVAVLAGVATVVAGWHRPSDAVAAFLVVGAWAALAGLALVLLERDGTGGRSAKQRAGSGGQASGAAHRVAVTVLALVGCALLVLAVIALVMTDEMRQVPPGSLSRGRAFVAYAGAVAGIAGVSSVMMASVLATVHRVVAPSRVPVKGSRG